jgi:hypothetical protein
MFCPQCGQKQLSNEVRFCSACGFPLNVVTGLLATGGTMPAITTVPAGPRKLSPRQKGIRQGAMLMLSALFIVPLVGIIGVALIGLPGEIAGVAAVTCLMGGLLRILYALLLEEKEAPDAQAGYAQTYTPPPPVPAYMNPPAHVSALPPAQSTPASAYSPPRRVNTGELLQRPSVTENTTRLLPEQPEDSTKQ